MLPTVHLIRHGATEWSATGRHTGLTDVPLTTDGEIEARDLRDRLRGTSFTQVLSSPLIRARRTCELTELSLAAEIEPDLREWDYGDFEGLRTAEIIARGHSRWNVFTDGCPDGESPAAITERADRVVARLRLCSGDVAVFSHAHFLRSLAVRWIGLSLDAAQRLYLNTGSISVVGFEHGREDEPVIQLWNERRRVR
ncbi:MAG: histidine phosphatase family protein [Opitutus sp.]